MADLKKYKAFSNNQFEILTDKGYQNFKGIFIGKNPEKIKFKFSNNSKLICTSKHKIMISSTKYKYAKDLHVNDIIYSNIKIIEKKEINNNKKVYEFLEIENTHTYFVNGILCHQCLLLDELAAVAPEIAKQFWASSYPVISASKKAKVFTMSTPNGTDNLFYELWDDASKGKNSWHPERIDWWDIPGRDEKWKEETIRNMGSIEIFNTEYGNTFQNVGEASIDEETFEKLVKKVTPPKLVLDDDHYLLWDQPSKDKLYAVGVDIGEGVGQAATVAQVLDITDLKSIKQVAVYHNNKISPIQFIPKLYEILCHWGKPPALIERNNCGAQVVDQLRQVFQYDNIVTYGVNTYNRIGVQAHTNTKYKGVTNERYWVNELNAVELNDINTINELKTFIRQSNGTWSARGDEQDDRVMSLIWCLMILDVDICQKYFEIVEKDKNNKPARIKLFDYGSSRTFKELEAILRRKIEKNTFEDGAMPFIMDFHGSQDDNEDITELQQMGWKLE